MRLINADELTALYGDDDALRVSVAVVKQNIADMPTIEVEPKHGRWINADELKEEIARRDSTDGFVKVYSGREVNEIIDLLTASARMDEVEE